MLLGSNECIIRYFVTLEYSVILKPRPYTALCFVHDEIAVPNTIMKFCLYIYKQIIQLHNMLLFPSVLQLE